MSHRGYVRSLGALVFGACGSLAAVNWQIDPYDYRGTLGIDSRQEYDQSAAAQGRVPDPTKASGVAHASREAKAYNIRWYRPDAVVFGSSTVWAWIDARHPGWRARGLRAFNFGIVAASADELEAYYRHAQRSTPMKQAVFGLEFFMFNANRARFLETGVPLAQSTGHAPAFAAYVARRLTSLETTRISLQRRGYLPYWPTTEDLVLAHLPILPESRARAAPTADEVRATVLEREYGAVRVLLLGRNQRFRFEEDGSSTLDCLRRILENAREEGVAVKLFVSPVHARHWELIRLMGLWPRVEEWFRQLVAIVDADARAHPGAPPVPLWTFGCYNAITTVELPRGAAPNRFVHYDDSLHYDGEIGNLVLDKVLEWRNDAPDFGVRLTPANVEAYLVETRRAQAEYVRTHGLDATELEEVIAKARRD